MKEITVAVRFFKSSMPKKKKFHHYWTTTRFGGLSYIPEYRFVGTFTRGNLRIYLHHNCPAWLWSDEVKTRALKLGWCWYQTETHEDTENGR